MPGKHFSSLVSKLSPGPDIRDLFLSSMSDPEVLEKLKQGVRRFQADVHADKAEQYHRIANTPQQPHTLIIACADSRVDVELITSSGPGEVFVARNIGNMVPAFGEMLGGVSAVIEYAVSALRVQHIVVCGHSDCGAMKALLDPESTDTMPTVKSWLTNGQAALMVTDSMGHPDDEPGDRIRRLTEQNVLMQLTHLRTHPSVAGALARGVLTTSGWVYEIGTGEVRIAREGQLLFEPVTGVATETAAAEVPADMAESIQAGG